jgi:hypothetical protein
MKVKMLMSLETVAARPGIVSVVGHARGAEWCRMP